MEIPAPLPNKTFSSYDKLVVFILAITQFTVILDFMVMSPLGDLLVKSLDIKTSEFGIVVSAYAFSAGISGFLTAGFADKYDRKKLLLFFYSGFIIGTLLCGIANSYQTLVTARIVTGLFGGVMGSISMAIVTDLFPLGKRGRVMSFVQMGSGASKVMGIPIGLYIANRMGWEAPFLFIGGMAIVIMVIIAICLKPVDQHLNEKRNRSSIKHLIHTLKSKHYRRGFLTISFLTIGGFMMMPYGTIYAVNNLNVDADQLPFLFMASGAGSLLLMPFVGRLSDKVSKFKMFAYGSLWFVLICITYTNLPPVPFSIVLILNIFLMMGIVNRMVPSAALISTLPEKEDRGAFMSIQSSIQQIAGGIAATFAGLIVYQQNPTSPLEQYDKIGYIVSATALISIVLMARIDRFIKKKMEGDTVPENSNNRERIFDAKSDLEKVK